jgi:hypothetical protein
VSVDVDFPGYPLLFCILIYMKGIQVNEWPRTPMGPVASGNHWLSFVMSPAASSVS